jgi:hypothetical protein
MAKIFISYRRDDSGDSTGRLFDRLKTHYGIDQLVRDVDSTPSGIDFREFLANEVNQCQVLLAVIGKNWQDIRDAAGKRRLEDPRDLVRIEIETALQRNIPIIPVVVGGAAFPDEKQLPQSLRPLVHRNGVFVRPDPDFHQDVDRLLGSLDAVLRTVDICWNCTRCGKQVRVPPSGAGKHAICPHCKTRQAVPTAPVPNPLKTHTMPVPAPRAAGGRGLVIGIVVVLLLLVLGGVAAVVVPRLLAPKPDAVALASHTRTEPAKNPDDTPRKTEETKKTEETPATPKGTRGVSKEVRQKAMTWIRENNKFGPDKPIVARMAETVENPKELCFVVTVGATLLKSKKTTVVGGRGDSLFLFELAPEQARPFPPGSALNLSAVDNELRLSPPAVVLSSPRLEHTAGSIRGSVDFTRRARLSGRLAVRLFGYLPRKNGKSTWTSFKEFVSVPADQGSLSFTHPKALAGCDPGPVLFFIELIEEGTGGTATIVSNPLAAVITVPE